ncbi:MAG: hypothetical protein QOE61_933 [Micromonosporaceae bacterium]|jgi:hypothetical protein|nr:hypothetical protein [Micromonosporaceae bacterium]
MLSAGSDMPAAVRRDARFAGLLCVVCQGSAEPLANLDVSS